MKRRLLRYATLLSLALCFAATALWARSRHHAVGIDFELPHSVCSLCSLGGTLYMGVFFDTDAGDAPRAHGPEDYAQIELRAWSSRDLDSVWELGDADVRPVLAVLAYGHDPNPASPIWVVGARLWVIVVCTLALPAARLVTALRQRRRARRGLCTRCGYDMRATPQRCPECGTAARAGTMPM